MNRAWIAIASAEHVRRGVAGGFAQVCHGKAAPLRRLAPGDVVRDDEYYFRCTPTFETCAGPHDWLCSSVFVGVGSRGPAGNVIRYWRVA